MLKLQYQASQRKSFIEYGKNFDISLPELPAIQLQIFSALKTETTHTRT